MNVNKETSHPKGNSNKNNIINVFGGSGVPNYSPIEFTKVNTYAVTPPKQLAHSSVNDFQGQRNNDHYEATRIKAQPAVPPNGGGDGGTWSLNFMKLSSFKNRFGHANPSITEDKDGATEEVDQLALWLNDQRRHFWEGANTPSIVQAEMLRAVGCSGFEEAYVDDETNLDQENSSSSSNNNNKNAHDGNIAHFDTNEGGGWSTTSSSTSTKRTRTEEVNKGTTPSDVMTTAMISVSNPIGEKDSSTTACLLEPIPTTTTTTTTTGASSKRKRGNGWDTSNTSTDNTNSGMGTPVIAAVTPIATSTQQKATKEEEEVVVVVLEGGTGGATTGHISLGIGVTTAVADASKKESSSILQHNKSQTNVTILPPSHRYCNEVIDLVESDSDEDSNKEEPSIKNINSGHQDFRQTNNATKYQFLDSNLETTITNEFGISTGAHDLIVQDGTKVKPTDILCGRDALCRNHVGNRKFKALVAEVAVKYHTAARSRPKRSLVLTQLMEHIQKANGRFLMQMPPAGKWTELTKAQARERVAQSIRGAIQYVEGSRTTQAKKTLLNQIRTNGSSKSNTTRATSTNKQTTPASNSLHAKIPTAVATGSEIVPLDVLLGQGNAGFDPATTTRKPTAEPVVLEGGRNTGAETQPKFLKNGVATANGAKRETSSFLSQSTTPIPPSHHHNQEVIDLVEIGQGSDAGTQQQTRAQKPPIRNFDSSRHQDFPPTNNVTTTYQFQDSNSMVTTTADGFRNSAGAHDQMLLQHGTQIEATDVLCGRGKISLEHIGNRKFRDLISTMAVKFETAKAQWEQGLVAKQTMEQIKKGDVRFLKQDPCTGKWAELREVEARTKVWQALCDATSGNKAQKLVKRKLRKTAHWEDSSNSSMVIKEPVTGTCNAYTSDPPQLDLIVEDPIIMAEAVRPTPTSPIGLSIWVSPQGGVIIKGIAQTSIFKSTRLRVGMKVISINDVDCQLLDKAGVVKMAKILKESVGVITIWAATDAFQEDSERHPALSLPDVGVDFEEEDPSPTSDCSKMHEESIKLGAAEATSSEQPRDHPICASKEHKQQHLNPPKQQQQPRQQQAKPTGGQCISWNDCLEQLKAFREENGHAEVGASKHSKWKGLARWLSCQRHQCRKGKLPKDKIQILQSMGVNLSHQKPNAMGL